MPLPQVTGIQKRHFGHPIEFSHVESEWARLPREFERVSE